MQSRKFGAVRALALDAILSDLFRGSMDASNPDAWYLRSAGIPRPETSNYAVLYTAKGVAAFIGAWGGPLLFERFGNWDACFYGSAALALIAAVMAWGLRASVAAPRAAGVGVPA